MNPKKASYLCVGCKKVFDSHAEAEIHIIDEHDGEGIIVKKK